MHQISKWRLFAARVKQNEAGGGLDLIIRATDKSEQPHHHKTRQVLEKLDKIPRKYPEKRLIIESILKTITSQKLWQYASCFSIVQNHFPQNSRRIPEVQGK